MDCKWRNQTFQKIDHSKSIPVVVYESFHIIIVIESVPATAIFQHYQKLVHFHRAT